MKYIHKEGYPTIIICLLISGLILFFIQGISIVFLCLLSVLLILFNVFIFSFFRNPSRPIGTPEKKAILVPADGKIVVIEEVEEREYLKERVRQISIFMSPLNVHVNRNPVNGEIAYEKYHKGKYLVAWHPKSSTDNERHTTVYSTVYGKILMRQIAGALARRIVNYTDKGQKAIQGETMGFIKFGSRVDVFIPLDAKVQVEMDQIVKGNTDVLAHFA